MYRESAAAGITPRRSLGPEGDFTIAPPVNDFAAAPATAYGRPTRILMTTTGHRPAWSQSLDLAGALGRFGIDVALATLGEPPSNGLLEEALRYPNLQVFPGRFGASWTDDAWDEVERAGDWLLRMEQHVEPDLVHLHAYPYGALPLQAPVLLEGHDCPLCRWTALRDGTAPLAWERYRQAVARALRQAQLVVAPTGAALRELAAVYEHLPPSRVIPVGRSPRRLQPSEKEHLILSAGCFGDETRDLRSLEAVARDVAWPVAVLLEEEGAAEDESARPVRLLRASSADTLASWYGRASIFALPCRYEPAGLSVLEAALAGCALVLGDVPALRELWQGAALFVAPGDPADLQRALDLLVAEPKGRRGLAQRARARALLLSPERRAASFLEAYAQLLRDETPISQSYDLEAS